MEIDWQLTGDVVDVIDIHDWTEMAQGYHGKDLYEAIATVSCGSIVGVNGVEKKYIKNGSSI